MSAPDPSQMMTLAAARRLRNGAVCFVGIGLPSTAANLARLCHAPDVVLIYESGTIGSKPSVLPLSIGDGELATTADTVVSTPEIFRYWLQAGRIDVGFLGAAQVDRFGNINTTVIGAYGSPQTRLPGAGGAPEIAALAGEVLIVVRQSRRSFVSALDFVTSVGHPSAVITDLCVLEPGDETRELVVTAMHPGVDREQIRANTGWPVRFATDVTITPPPSEAELNALQTLLDRTARAHGSVA